MAELLIIFLTKYCMANIEETTSWTLFDETLMRFFSELPWKNMARGFETLAIIYRGKTARGKYVARVSTSHTTRSFNKIYGLSASLSGFKKKSDKVRH